MAITDNTTEIDQTNPTMEVVRTQLTGSSSTYVSKLSTIWGVLLAVEGTNGATYTWSSKTVTIAGTDNDWVTMVIWGVQ